MIRSLRTRLLVGTTMASAVALLLLAVAVHVAVRRSIYAEFDESLLAKAQALATMVEIDGGAITFEFSVHDLPEFAPGAQCDYFQLWIGGHTYARSPSLGKDFLIQPGGAGQAVVQDAVLPDGRPGRIVVLPFFPHPENPSTTDLPASTRPAISAVIAVGRDTLHLQHVLARLGWIVASLCLAAVAVSGASILLAVGSALRPVGRLAHHIERLDETALSTQLDARGIPTELQPIIEKINALLLRLHEAFARERAFTADVAHELRTPIAGLRATLEVCRSRPRSGVEYSAALDKSLLMLASMQELVENLLLLARADAGQLSRACSSADLVALLRDAWSPFAQPAAAINTAPRWEVPDSCVADCDPAKLRIVFANLFDNAIAYMDRGGKLVIRLQQTPQVVLISVTNTGSRIAPAEIPHLFERFWRKDEARAQTGRHAGLGLSLCQRLIRLSGGDIAIASTAGGEFTAMATLPRHPANANPAATDRPPAWAARETDTPAST